jgi:cell division protein FtsQ
MKKVLLTLFAVPVCIVSMLSIIYLVGRGEQFFSVNTVRINGVSQLNDGDVMKRVTPFLKGTIFRMDFEKMREAVTAHPFVREASIKHVFPFSLVIDVKERQPSAFWLDKGGDLHILDENGEPYRKVAKNEKKGMFIITASQKDGAKTAFREAELWMREDVIKREIISEVAYNDGSITIFSDKDGVEIILGTEHQRERLKRALSILDDARKRGLLIKCIDARFEKGAIIQQERKG